MNLLLTLCFLLAAETTTPVQPHAKCKCTAESHCGCVDGKPCTCGHEKEPA